MWAELRGLRASNAAAGGSSGFAAAVVGGVGLVDSTIDVEMPGTAQRLLKVL